MSPVDICNIALAHIGDRRISRLDTDAQAEDALVRYCSEFYELAKDQALAAHRWTFAKKAAILSRESNPVLIGNYSYSHVVPTDMLRLMTVYPGSVNNANVTVYSDKSVDHFKLIDRRIWSNTLNIAIEYVAKSTDPDRWTPHFKAAVARLLAHYLAGAIADDPSMAFRHMDIYEKVDLPNAQFYDSVQDNSGENDDIGIIRADSRFLASHRSGYTYTGASPLDDDDF
jgi:hypothetical protein